MQRNARIVLAASCFVLISLLFLDFSGTIHPWFGWLARMQFGPAIIAANMAIVAAIIVFTGLFGRIYCSILCPLGIVQDMISWLAGRKSKCRFSFKAGMSTIRYSVLLVAGLALVGGIGAVVALLDPYSIFGRLMTSVVSPLYRLGNNLLATGAACVESYAFYSVDVRILGFSALALSLSTGTFLAVLAWKQGRVFCNAVCPVGTMLGLLARFSWFRVQIQQEKCTGCGVCEKSCKASCIDAKTGQIDHSRCVVCFDCVERCPQGVIEYRSEKRDGTALQIADSVAGEDGGSRRKFLAMSSLFVLGTAKEALAKKFDGGFAFIEDMQPPARTTHLVPPGAMGISHFTRHCTGCLLCVSACPNQVLRPSSKPERFMQPEMSFERGYCRPECTRCSEVCPNGAIVQVTAPEKSAIQIGRAIWRSDLCVVNKDKKGCNNCERHCPPGAIKMIPQEPANPSSLKIPMIDEGRCTGCGACETLCPARPASAIYVEGIERHGSI